MVTAFVFNVGALAFSIVHWYVTGSDFAAFNMGMNFGLGSFCALALWYRDA